MEHENEDVMLDTGFEHSNPATTDGSATVVATTTAEDESKGNSINDKGVGDLKSPLNPNRLGFKPTIAFNEEEAKAGFKKPFTILFTLEEGVSDQALLKECMKMSDYLREKCPEYAPAFEVYVQKRFKAPPSLWDNAEEAQDFLISTQSNLNDLANQKTVVEQVDISDELNPVDIDALNKGD
jgi:hypothetical protein